MGQRTCVACGLPKDDDDFNWKNKAKGWRQSYCKLCQKEHGAKHYIDNKDDYKRRARDRRRNTRQLFLEWLSTKSCIDCGESDPVVLQCDHVRGTKTYGLSVMVKDGRSWTLIEEEIKKCEIRCANCHTRRTAKQFGWLKAI